jgi:hypothetical protein
MFMQKQEIIEIIGEGEAIIEDDKMLLRARDNRCYKCSLNIVKSNAFTIFIAICILINTVVLALDRHPISDAELIAIEYTNLLFYGVFVVEMIINLFGLGFRAYLKEGGRVFDMILVIISTIDLLY